MITLHRFSFIFGVSLERKSKKIQSKMVSKTIRKSSAILKCILFMFFVDFGSILAPQIDPKLENNYIKKRSDFKTKLAGRPTIIGPRKVARQAPLAAAYMRALSSHKQRKKGRMEERRKGGREEVKIGRKSRMTERAP